MNLSKECPALTEARAEIERLRKALRLCVGQAAVPDPLEACRLIIRTAADALDIRS